MIRPTLSIRFLRVIGYRPEKIKFVSITLAHMHTMLMCVRSASTSGACVRYAHPAPTPLCRTEMLTDGETEDIVSSNE